MRGQVMLNVNRVVTFRWVEFLTEVSWVLHTAFLADIGPANDDFEDKESGWGIHGNICLISHNTACAKLLVLILPNKDALLLHNLPLISTTLWHVPTLNRRLLVLLFEVDAA